MDLIAFWPIFFAGLAAFIIGFLWYNAAFGFGRAWMRLSGITPEMVERGKKRMPVSMGVGFLAALWTAWVLSYVLAAFGVFDWISAVEVGFWVWAGFVAPVMLGMVLWEQKPFKLYLINALYWLVAMVIMSVMLIVAMQALIPAGTPYLE